MPMAYGYYVEAPQFDASRHKTDKKIKSIGVFNIDKDRVYKLMKYIESQQDRIKDSTGYNVKTKDDVLDRDRFDIYISLMSGEEYEKDSKERKMYDYTHNLKNISLGKLSDDKLEEAYDLLDKLFNL